MSNKPISNDPKYLQLYQDATWSSEEDKIILQFFNEKSYSVKQKLPWQKIANTINEILHNNRKVRNCHKIRERFNNHLNPHLKKGNWTQNEDEIILRKKFILNKDWSEISRKLQGRNNHQVKNRFYQLVNLFLKSDKEAKATFQNVLTISKKIDFATQYSQCKDKRLKKTLTNFMKKRRNADKSQVVVKTEPVEVEKPKEQEKQTFEISQNLIQQEQNFQRAQETDLKNIPNQNELYPENQVGGFQKVNQQFYHNDQQFQTCNQINTQYQEFQNPYSPPPYLPYCNYYPFQMNGYYSQR